MRQRSIARGTGRAVSGAGGSGEGWRPGRVRPTMEGKESAMTHRTHALRPGSQWRRAPSAPVSLRPRTVLLVAGGVALAAALVVAVGVGTQYMLFTTKLPLDFTRSLYAPLARKRAKNLWYRFPVEIQLARLLGIYGKQD